MGRSNLRYGSVFEAQQPSQQAVSAWPSDHPRPKRPSKPCDHALGQRETADPSILHELSPFVLARDVSESGDANSSGTSLAVPDRLAGDQQDRSLHAGGWALRTLPASPWTPCGATRRHGRRVVGSGDRCLARRSRSAAAPGTGLRSARGHPNDAQARLSCHCPPQSRSDLQRAEVAQSRRALSALPHDPRWPGTPPASLVECLSPSRVGRPLHRPIQLAWLPASEAGEGVRCALRAFECKKARREGRMPLAVRRCSGARNDRSLSGPQDDGDGAATARR